MWRIRPHPVSNAPPTTPKRLWRWVFSHFHHLVLCACTCAYVCVCVLVCVRVPAHACVLCARVSPLAFIDIFFTVALCFPHSPQRCLVKCLGPFASIVDNLFYCLILFSTEVISKVGQMQLLRRQIANILNFSCKLDSNTLYCALEVGSQIKSLGPLDIGAAWYMIFVWGCVTSVCTHTSRAFTLYCACTIFNIFHTRTLRLNAILNWFEHSLFALGFNSIYLLCTGSKSRAACGRAGSLCRARH